MTDSPSEFSEKNSEVFSAPSNYCTDKSVIPITASPGHKQGGQHHGSFRAHSYWLFKSPSDDGIEDGNDLIDWLQMLLEAERAGALIMVDSLKEARDEALILQLEALHVSEAASCQRLRRSLKRLGAVPSKKVSDFHAKTMIIADMDERLMFIARGQRWVAKRIEEKLPTISQRWLYEELKAVLTLHI